MTELPTLVPAREVRPGGTIRFAVGALTGLRSSRWRIWSKERTVDFYLAIRSVAGVQKISFHQSGSWAHSFISDEKAEPFVPKGASRHLHLWQRPPPFADRWHRVYTIIVPWTELRPSQEPEQGDVAFIPHPGVGYWVYVDIVVASPDTQTRLQVANEIFLLGSMTLVDGSEIKIIARRMKPKTNDAATLAVARERAILESKEFLASFVRTATNPRMAIFGIQSDGTPFTADLAVLPPPPGYAVICTGRPHYIRISEFGGEQAP